jgi:peptidoglycan-associated lipoprotein
MCVKENSIMRSLSRRSVPGVLVAFALVTLCSCHKKPPATTAHARQNPAPATAPPPSHAAPAPGTRQDVAAEDIATLNRRGYLKDVYFDFNEATLRDDARTSLATDAQWLERNPSIQILIEGHCDDRGTEAYNLSLGDRRANAAREYLASLGVDGSRVKTVSYGKERPFCDQDTEPCWRENRRDHVLVTAK